MNDLDAEYFDRWYSDMAVSLRREAIQQHSLGLPPQLQSTSLLSWAGIADVVAVLEIGDGDVLLDLACGRGGYGIEVAARTGAALIGVDFSAVAIDAARRNAAARPEVSGDFRVGNLVATGLPASSITAILCVDAMQFAQPYADGVAECLRILAPGGRLVLTGWEAVDPGDDATPERLRHDVGAMVRAAGFDAVEVREMTRWRQAEKDMWEAAVAADADGDPAIEAMRAEGTRVLAVFERIRRVLVTARAPG